MSIIGAMFGGLNDGRPGALSHLDGSNGLEQLLMRLTGSQGAQGPAPVVAGQLPPAMARVAPQMPLQPQAGGYGGVGPGLDGAPLRGPSAPALPPRPPAALPQRAASPQQGRRGASFMDYLLLGPEAGLMMEDRAMARDKLALQQQLAAQAASVVGGGAGGAGGPGLSSDPRQGAMQLAQLQAAGIDTGPFAKLLEMTAPKAMNVNGHVINERDPGVYGRYFGDAPAPGAEPVYDSNQRQVGWQMANGAIQAAASLAGAVEGAKAQATAPYEFQSYQTPTGAPAVASRAALAGAGPLVGQAPADAARANILATTSAEAQADLGRTVSTANETLGLIEMIRQHPGRKFGTGATGVIPGIPGTLQNDFIQLVEQVKGKAFLEAFNSLKGGGQITEKEGQAAQAALARLNRAQSEEGFLQALNDFEAVIKAGTQRARQKAGQSQRGSYSRQALEAEARRRGLM